MVEVDGTEILRKQRLGGRLWTWPSSLSIYWGIWCCCTTIHRRCRQRWMPRSSEMKLKGSRRSSKLRPAFQCIKDTFALCTNGRLFISPFWRQWNFIQVPMSCTESPVQCHAIRCLEPVRQLDRCQGASTSDHKPGRRLLSEKDLEIVPNLVN